MSDNAADRRWAHLARELEFTQLPELRRQAEGWRGGLTGLTALLAVLTVVKGNDSLANVPDTARYTAIALASGAFCVLVAGTLLAVRAAHGRPGAEIVLGGQSLRRWTGAETARVVRALRRAAVCCVAGLALSAAAVGVVWATTEAPSPHLVRVTTPTADLCGELVKAGPDGIVVRTGRGDVRKPHTVPLRDLKAVAPVAACGG